ncbi:MAG: L-aspartate oxidase, partial [Miltoncostaeaceae bacterium]|nr:L-aspartate oxidase [Miltoncostaeaceae bacterium]
MKTPTLSRDPTPLLVVGSGIAGLLVALRAAADGPVIVITKADLQEGSTRHAQGGLAAAVGRGDSTGAHLADTLAVGAGLSDRAAAVLMCAEAPARVADLLALGVPFDRERGRLSLAREGAHSAPRVLHAGGDATGAHLAATLAAAARSHPQIAIAEGETALEVVVRDGRAAGLRTRDGRGLERVREGRAVVLATGGSGQLFSRTTNPPVATADGPALASRAGAALADLELIQFHPTALAVGASPLPLVSEAVRGEGAVLRDAAGRRFMLDLHPL